MGSHFYAGITDLIQLSALQHSYTDLTQSSAYSTVTQILYSRQPTAQLHIYNTAVSLQHSYTDLTQPSAYSTITQI